MEPRRYEPVNLSGPVTRNVALTKILSNPALYSGQLVELQHSYCLGGTADRQPDGTVRVTLVESSIKVSNSGQSELRRGNRADLEADSRLAEQLVRIGKLAGPPPASPLDAELDDKPAIVTVLVASERRQGTPAPRVVKLEFFEKVEPEAFGKAKKVPRIHYFTRTVTPADDSAGQGLSDEWKRMDRLGSLDTYLVKVVRAEIGKVSQQKRQEENRQINDMIRLGTQRSVQDQMDGQRARQRSLMP